MSMSSWVERHFTPVRALYVLTFVLFLNYVDRGIIPGIVSDLKDTFSTGGTGVGILQSSFMIGYIAGALVFAQLAARIQPFNLIGIGLSIWILASLFSAVAGFLCENGSSSSGRCLSYYMMIFTRALSGVGEASMNTLSLPFLDDVLPKRKKGFYIGIYYCAIPVGTAFGFMLSGLVSEVTKGEWEWTFVLQAPLMIPFAFLAFATATSSIPDIAARAHQNRLNNQRSISSTNTYEAAEQEYRQLETSLIDRQSSTQEQQEHQERISLRENLMACLTRPAWVLAALAYAAYTGIIAGLSFYGPTFIQDYRPEDASWDFSQSEADMIFGVMISVSGLLGTLLGGWMVDRLKESTHGKKNRNGLLMQLIGQLLLGFGVSILGIYLTNPAAFFIVLFFGSCSVFAVSAGVNLMLMWTVPSENRAMSGALSVFIIHALGDVPSPVIIGIVSDHKSPLFTLTLCVSGILLPVALFAAAIFVPLEQRIEDEIEIEDDEDDEDDDLNQDNEQIS